MPPHPFLRFELLAACLLLPAARAWAAEPAPVATGPRIRSAEIREAIRAGLLKYQPQPADTDVKMTDSGGPAVEREGVLNLPSVIVEAQALPRATEYDFLTHKGRVELALKRRPGLKIGNLFGLNNGIALALLQEDIRVEKINALKDQVKRVSLDDGPDNRELSRLLEAAIVRPNSDWLNGRSGR